MGRRLCAISVDLDEIPNYFGLYGLPAPPTHALARTAGYDVGLLRLASFAEAYRFPLTLFAIGADLERASNAAALRALARRGHAVENHSFSHRYDFARQTPAEIGRDIQRGADAIHAATGTWPTGFRAPGYTVTDEVFDAIEELGVGWDSSVFPCPAYYAAKAAILAATRMGGRRSSSHLDSPRVLFAPRRPYRPGRPWNRPGGRRFVELPIQVTPSLRLPLIGTMLAVSGPAKAARVAESCVGEELVNIELHLMDFLDQTDGLSALFAYQPELRIPLATRLSALAAAVDVFRREGYAFVRLDEAVDAVAA
jgi:peptidoglycan-N-acetylglucosamine deacetylase